VGDLAGEDKFMDSGEIVAANAKLFTALLKALGESGRARVAAK
jgi:hypothetical protein